jgi:hypothetical protein
MSISPQQANGIWLRYGNGEAIGLPEETIPSHPINAA